MRVQVIAGKGLLFLATMQALEQVLNCHPFLLSMVGTVRTGLSYLELIQMMLALGTCLPREI